MSVSVKICGLSTKKTLEAAIEAGADYAGFVFFEKSPRNVSLKQAARLARLAEGRIKTVALTVNATDAAIEAIMAEVHPGFLQLHGDESLQRIADTRSLSQASIIKAIKVGGPKDISAARRFESAADILLFDAKAIGICGALPGGNGLAFDWTWLPRASPRPDFMLSGGLNAENVLEALSASGALAVDVSSGVETSPGVKTPARIRKFVKIAKSFAPAMPASTAAQKGKSHVYC
ncbi:MAG: phosphoribosylanthranilate isomerase [Rhodomicrobium sp.]